MREPSASQTGVNLLSVSGGGFRGLYTLEVLDQIERALTVPITHKFALVAGTSIGGIIALALSAGHRPAQLKQIFMEHRHSVFPHRSGRMRRFSRAKGIITTLYNSKGLRRVVDELFGNLRMCELDKCNVVVPTANISTGRPQFFKTSHHEGLWADGNVPVRDVAMATAAAPIYFPVHMIGNPGASYIDGGIVGNAPGLFALTEAMSRLGKSIADIHVLAVGTLGAHLGASRHRSLRPWFGFWLNPFNPRLLTQLFAIQERQTDNMLKILLGDQYVIVDSSIQCSDEEGIALDDVSDHACEVLVSRATHDARNFLTSSFYRRLLNDC